MMYGYVGTYDDNSADSLRGTGKTTGMTYFAYLDHRDEGRKVFTNYYTTFSEQMGAFDIIELIREENLKNVTICLTEIQDIIDSLGTKGEIVKFVGKLVNQSRKREIDIRWDSQRFMNVHKRIRVQTDMVLKPRKYDAMTGNICKIDRCKKHPHLIAVFVVRPYLPDPIKVLRSWVVGKLFDSDQLTDDTITKEQIKKTKVSINQSVGLIDDF